MNSLKKTIKKEKQQKNKLKAKINNLYNAFNK